MSVCNQFGHYGSYSLRAFNFSIIPKEFLTQEFLGKKDLFREVRVRNVILAIIIILELLRASTVFLIGGYFQQKGVQNGVVGVGAKNFMLNNFIWFFWPLHVEKVLIQGATQLGATGLRASEREICLWEGLWKDLWKPLNTSENLSKTLWKETLSETLSEADFPLKGSRSCCP